MRTPTVAIVTPSHNQAAYLEETILSVLGQDYPNIEYVLVDDGSTDGSLEIARRYESRLTKLIAQPNAGQVAAINHGFEHTTGEYMAYINSDDTLLPGAVSEMVAELEAHPEAVLVYGDSVYTDAESRELDTLPARAWEPAVMVANCDNHVPQPSSMWRRSAWDVVGPFDPSGYYFFDFELNLRLSQLGAMHRVDRLWSTYRLHPESKSDGDQLGKAHDYIRFADEFLRSERLPAGLQPYVRRGRANARIAAANNVYGQLELGLARRWVLEAIRTDPGSTSRLSLSLLAKTALPRELVARLRKSRARRRRAMTTAGTP